MRAALYYGNKDIRVEDVPEQSVGPTDVKVNVSYTGICGTDLHEYVAGPILTPANDPHPVTGETTPIIFGHEVSGVVQETGDEVERVHPGNKVTINPMLPCGDCQYCLAGKRNVCVDLGFVGLSGGGGGFAESIVLDEANVVRLPESVSLRAGALVEPLAVGLHAVRHSPVKAGDIVAVFGSGPIGLCVVQAAKAAGAGRIIVSEPQMKRRSVAEQVGADVTIDPTMTDPVEEIMRMTSDGVEVAFEVAGVNDSFNQALQSTQHDGHLRVVSLYEKDVSFNPNDLVTVERTISGSNVYTGGPRSEYEYGMVVSMINKGELVTDPLISDIVELEDIHEGFNSLLNDDHVKILVEP